MAHLIKNNPRIRGVKIKEDAHVVVEEVLSQFADDSALFLEYSQETLDATIDTLTIVENHIGLEISYEKTVLYRVGSLRNTDAKLYSAKNIAWSDGDIEMLGVTIENKCDQGPESLNQVIDKMETVLQVWHHRRLTLMGRVLIVNSLAASLFVYKMSVLPLLTSKQVGDIMRIVLNFVWQGRRSKIPVRTLQRQKKDGGLKLCNFELKHKSLLIQWIPRLRESPFLMHSAQICLPKCGVEKIWGCNLSRNDAMSLLPFQSFWGDVLMAWCDLYFHQPDGWCDVMTQTIWYNSHIRAGNTPIPPIQAWVEEGLWYVRDLLDDGMQLMTWRVFSLKFPRIKWFEYVQITQAIPRHWLAFEVEGETNRIDYEELVCTKKPSAMAYNLLLVKEYDVKDDYINIVRWSRTCGNIETLQVAQYRKLFTILYKITDVTKLRNFQYRLLLSKVFNKQCVI